MLKSPDPISRVHVSLRLPRAFLPSQPFAFTLAQEGTKGLDAPNSGPPLAPPTRAPLAGRGREMTRGTPPVEAAAGAARWRYPLALPAATRCRRRPCCPVVRFCSSCPGTHLICRRPSGCRLGCRARGTRPGIRNALPLTSLTRTATTFSLAKEENGEGRR